MRGLTTVDVCRGSKTNEVIRFVKSRETEGVLWCDNTLETP